MKVDYLHVRLGGRLVLDDVDFAVEPGRVTVLLGPNGAGKSTLLRTMAGLIVPQGGQVTVGGRDIARWPANERARTIGYLPQQGDVAWNMVAQDVVALGRLPHRSDVVADTVAIAAALAATDTAALADRRIGELSGGERSRVLLARVLAGEPQWLLADEPLASLDPAHQLDLLDRLREQAARGVGVVVVLHDVAQAARVADDAILMAGGRMVAAGAAADVLTPDALGELFGVRFAAVPGHPVGIAVERLDR